VGSYAWGAGTLAYLYRQLGQASRSKAKGIAGFLPLLEAWIYTYFPSLRPGAGAPLQPGEPGIRAWQGVKVPASFELLSSFRERIDAFTAHSVRWVYPSAMHVAHPSTLFSGCIRFMEIVEPYQPDRCLRQFGYTQTIPQPMPFGDYYRPASAAVYKVEVGLYADHNWMSMSNHLLHLPSISSGAPTWTETTAEYWEWYCRISHRFLVPPAQRQQNLVEDDLDAGSQLGLALANAVQPIWEMDSPTAIWNYVQSQRGYVTNLLGRIAGGRGGMVGQGVPEGRPSRGRGMRGGRSAHTPSGSQ